MSVATVLKALALICFVFAAVGVALGPFNLVALGLAFWVAASLP